MGNYGVLKISNTILTISPKELLDQIQDFLNSTEDLIKTERSADGTISTYVLKHSDFTEPDWTEYKIVLTQDTLNRPYIYALEVWTSEGYKRVKIFESPYAEV